MITTWHHHHNLSHDGELRKLYWSRFSLSLAGGLVSIFIPIYLLQNHTSLPMVILFYLVLVVTNIVLAPLAFRAMTAWGSNISMFVANLVHISVYLLLIVYRGDQFLLFFIAVLCAVANELYWPAFHANFSTAENTKQSGQQVSFLTVVTGLAQALTPLIGGLIAVFFGIKVLYLPAAVIIFIGSLPLLTHKSIIRERKVEFKDLDPVIAKTDMVAVFGSSMIAITEQVVWPIAMFLALGNLALIGGLSTLGLLLSVLAAVYVGRQIYKRGTKHYINNSSPFVSLMNVLRILASGVVAISGLNMFAGIANSFNGTAYTTAFYRNASRSSRLAYLLVTEWIWQIGWIFVLVIMYALATRSNQLAISAALIAAAVGGLLVRRIRHLEISS